MARKRYKPEETVAKLRQADVLVSPGQSVVDSVRSIGVTDVTYYRWRSEFGGQYTDSSNPLVLTQERALFGAIGLRQDF